VTPQEAHVAFLRSALLTVMQARMVADIERRCQRTPMVRAAAFRVLGVRVAVTPPAPPVTNSAAVTAGAASQKPQRSR
jgi:hypothetical protein